MTFEEKLDQILELTSIPKYAKESILLALSPEAKQKMMEIPTDEAARALQGAIDEINHGSISRIDPLVREALDRGNESCY